MPRESMIQPKALREQEAAIYTGYSEAYLKASRLQGPRPGRTPGPPFLRIGRKVLYLVDDLDRWLEAHRVEVSTPPAVRAIDDERRAAP